MPTGPQPPPGRRFGTVVAAKRKERRWTLQDLAAAAGVSRWTVSRLEAGTAIPSEDVAAALDDALEAQGGLVALGADARAARPSAGGPDQAAANDFGAAVTRKRAERGWTKQRLADEAHVARSTISRLEAGLKVPSEDIAAALDRALGTNGGLVSLGKQARAEPHSLPSPLLFVGRTADLARLDDLVDGLTAAAPPTVALIAGPPGVGKTALALRWANDVKGRFDTVLWSDLRGYSGDDGLRDAADILEDLLRGLDIPAGRMPTSAEARLALLRQRLRGRQHRVLIVLDNARNLAQLKPVLPGTPGTIVVITSRRRIYGLALDALPIHIPLARMDDADGARLLAALIGEDRVRAEPDAVERMVNLCAALPLALRIAGTRVAADPGTSIAEHAAALADRGRLHLLEGDDRAIGVRAAFSWSYKALPPADARMFRLLGLHPGPRFSGGSAAASAGLAPGDAAALLDHLVGAHLVREIDGQHYSLHDLLRVYAAQEIAAPEWEQERAAATSRLVQWYLHGLNAAGWAITPTRDHHVHLDPPPADVRPPRFDSATGALAWCESECENIAPIVQLAYDHGMLFEAWRMTMDAFEYFFHARPWQTWQVSTEIALRAAQDVGDPSRIAEAAQKLADLHRRQERYDPADELDRLAVRVLEPLRPHPRLGWSLVGLGGSAHALARYDEAVDLIEQALAAHLESDTRIGELHARVQLCRAYRSIGDHKRALDEGIRALEAFRADDDLHGMAFALVPLARAHRAAGDDEQAMACWEQAAVTYRAAGDRWGEADAVGEMGLLLADRDDVAAARELLADARRMMEPLDDAKAAQLGAALDRLARGNP
ncbi:helix-turn-helix domain-containing protein [Kutzneria buriramensis]|uniref:NB-ARC domain-containing protein n=1 Tax=Kutzneria buriramensis TaxID=1045776 RepID=A0A3E0HDN9_9PSEU|nr:helix-turn-helix domain-containing protein [Kutzneria buriramensis]REH42903.1 NB-ARC domain-containing protein [Kutzneria buriramensis]